MPENALVTWVSGVTKARERILNLYGYHPPRLILSIYISAICVSRRKSERTMFVSSMRFVQCF